jgi:site-specific DNA recombinase
VYNRQHCVKDPQTGKRIFRSNPESEWIRAETPHLKIIDDKIWEVAQTIKSRYSSSAGNKRQIKKRLLTGLIKCGKCVGGMTIIRHDRYYCSAKRERGTSDSSVGIAASEVERRVVTGLQNILSGNEDLIAEFTETFNAEINRSRNGENQKQRDIQRELKKANSAINRCLTFIREGDGNPGIVRDELTTLEKRKLYLTNQVAVIRDEMKIEPHPNIPALFER